LSSSRFSASALRPVAPVPPELAVERRNEHAGSESSDDEFADHDCREIERWLRLLS
jgi:hypothetical protein